MLVIGYSISSTAQLVHTKGQMGVGARYGIGYKGWDLGLLYKYQITDKLGLIAELDREDAEFDYSDCEALLLGVGCDYMLWNPTLWLFFHASACGNIGHDGWDCNVINWKHDAMVYGGSVGVDAEMFPIKKLTNLSFIIKVRQWILASDGDVYAKPDYSLGVKWNW